jgi:DNA (cytosine-5)-methyltransferase 1
MVYYGSDGAGGFQTLDRPLRTVTTIDRFAYVRPNGDGHEIRMLQPLELAAAMGFPTTHLWPVSSRRDKIRLIGNAVCPPVMAAIIQHLTLREPPKKRGGSQNHKGRQAMTGDVIAVRRFVDL